jgi:hypothetical protein
MEGGPAKEVVWTVHKQDGIGIHMADNLRAMVFRLGYDVGPAYHCELWTHPWFEPH